MKLVIAPKLGANPIEFSRFSIKEDSSENLRVVQSILTQNLLSFINVFIKVVFPEPLGPFKKITESGLLEIKSFNSV